MRNLVYLSTIVLFLTGCYNTPVNIEDNYIWQNPTVVVDCQNGFVYEAYDNFNLGYLDLPQDTFIMETFVPLYENNNKIIRNIVGIYSGKLPENILHTNYFIFYNKVNLLY